MLILWENLNYLRVEAVEKNKYKSSLSSSKEEQLNTEIFYFKGDIPYEFSQTHEIIEKESLLDWFVDNNNDDSLEIFIVSNNTPEGDQFVKSFDGIGSILLYGIQNDEEDYDEYDDSTNPNNQEDEDEFI